MKLSKTIINTELNHEESSFVQYLRWKMIHISNRCNERTRQLMERMTTMINHGVNKIKMNFVLFLYLNFIFIRLQIFLVIIHLFKIY